MTAAVHPFLTRVRTTLRVRALWHPGQRVLLAVSGGADSVAMAHALCELGVPVGLCVVDHGLRPESAEEARAVMALAARLGVPGATRRVEVARDGRGLEDAARRARYAALEEERSRGGWDLVATAHTRTDQAETVLSRLVRGAGLRGLSGIPPRAGCVIRPLIDASREEPRAFLREKGEAWVEDPHNEDPRFLRARIRQRLWPVLLELNPRIEEALAGLADRLRADADALDRAPDAAREVLALARRAGLDPDARAVSRMLRARAAGRDPLREAYGRLPGGAPRRP